MAMQDVSCTVIESGNRRSNNRAMHTIEPSYTEESIRVRYGETDQMGHAYYANYLYWFEQARGAWCRARGFTYKSLEEMGYMLPAVEVHVRYGGEVKYDDVITVRVWMEEIKRAAMQFKYEVLNEAG